MNITVSVILRWWPAVSMSIICKGISTKPGNCSFQIKNLRTSYTVCVNLKEFCQSWKIPAAFINGSAYIAAIKILIFITIVKCRILTCCPCIVIWVSKETCNLYKIITSVFISIRIKNKITENRCLFLCCFRLRIIKYNTAPTTELSNTAGCILNIVIPVTAKK